MKTWRLCENKKGILEERKYILGVSRDEIVVLTQVGNMSRELDRNRNTLDRVDDGLRKKKEKKHIEYPTLSREDIDKFRRNIQQKQHNDVISEINHSFGVLLTPDLIPEEPTPTLLTLRAIATESFSETDSYVLDKVLAEIKKRVEGKPEWTRILAVRGMKVLWVVARKLAPGFENAESVINDLHERKFSEAVVGIVKVFAPDIGKAIDCYSWIIKLKGEE